LEDQKQGLEEFRKEVELDKKSASNNHEFNKYQTQEIPVWRKDLMEKKKEWVEEQHSSKRLSSSRKKVNEFQENSLQFLQQKAVKLLSEAYIAIEEGNMSNFNQVFETKSEIDFLDMFIEGNTLLHHCVTYNRPKMALSLLGNGALFIKNGLDLTPVDMVKASSELDPSYSELLQLYLEWE